jgi:hypothetical protein
MGHLCSCGAHRDLVNWFFAEYQRDQLVKQVREKKTRVAPAQFSIQRNALDADEATAILFEFCTTVEEQKQPTFALFSKPIGSHLHDDVLLTGNQKNSTSFFLRRIDFDVVCIVLLYSNNTNN